MLATLYNTNRLTPYERSNLSCIDLLQLLPTHRKSLQSVQERLCHAAWPAQRMQEYNASMLD